jgi:hypothetical protein
VEPTNHDESLIPGYTLPEPVRMENGIAVTNAAQWPARRAELLELFARHQYGFAPTAPVTLEGRVLSEDASALGGAATLKQVEVALSRDGKSHSIGLLLFIPNAAVDPVPAFLGLNFYGNHTVHADLRIRLQGSWSPDNEELRVTGNRATTASRGLRADRWPVETIIAHGFALATVYSGDIDPDFDDGFRNGVHGLFGDADFSVTPDERWGTIAAWAWGLSRILDYMVCDEPAIDAARVIAIGHSRMGKAALWAAASDSRFAAAISNNSGCAGAALHRRRFGERLVDLNTSFPHWLNGRCKRYNEREADLPVDQHQLISSAAEDLWADPKGEYLSLLHAKPVWRLLGVNPALPSTQPPVGAPVTGPLSYHIRPGQHDILPEDWSRFLDFAYRQVRYFLIAIIHIYANLPI